MRLLLCLVAMLAKGAATQYPEHWGPPPKAQTRDYKPLPGGYGYGSSTLAQWIGKHIDEDNANAAGSGSQLGETCEGFDEMTGTAFPKCASGLVCQSSGEISIPGAGKKCYKSPSAMPGGLRPLDRTDVRLGEVVTEVFDSRALERAMQASGRNGMLLARPEIVSAASQVVAGTNYFVKLKLADGEYAHVRIYDRFGSVSLTLVQVAKGETDPLEYF